MNAASINQDTLYRAKLNSIRLRKYVGAVGLGNMVVTLPFIALFGLEYICISALSLIVLLVLVLRFDTNSNVMLLNNTTITYLRKDDPNPVIYGYDELKQVDAVRGVKTSGYTRFTFMDGAKYKGVLERSGGLDVSYNDFRAFILERNDKVKVFVK